MRIPAGPITAFACALGLMLPGAAKAFDVQAVFPFGPAHVGVAFTDSVDIATALQASRYALVPDGGAPMLAIQTVRLQDNQRTVILTTTSSLPLASTYTITVSGVTSRRGDALATGGPLTLSTPAVPVTGIADVHADINALIGQTVTVIGEVYIRAGSVTGTPSGYIQDGTGRGLNVFGTPLLGALDALGTVALVTGTAALYFTTVELTNLSATPIATGMPLLAPKVLSVPEASSPQWEGTYIQSTATLAGPPTASGSNHYNYPAVGDGVPFYFRVRNSVGVDPGTFIGNETVTGLGAGTNFQGTYQITVGAPGGFFKGTGTGDITPPVLVAAEGTGGASEVVVTFSEPVAAGAADPASYTLASTASPAATIAVTAASVAGATVTLTLGAPLVAATNYTLGVAHVFDSAGNEIPAGHSIAFTAAVPVPYGVAGVFRFGSAYVGVGFTGPVNASAAVDPSHYTFSPPLTISDARLQENGATVILHASAPLPPSTTYQVTVMDVPGATGEPLAGGGPFTFTTGAETVTDIATIHQNLSAYSGTVVTMIGQVTIPVGSRGSTPSGYIQDASGRGINVFGGSIQGAVNALGSVARVTGTVTPYFTTVEVTDYTATALATGMPHLGAKRMSIAEASSAAWEGTYIEASGTLTDIAASGTSNVAYTAVDGPSAITFRIGNGLGILPGQFVVGDAVTGRGAGGSYQTTYQINVGNLPDFFLSGSGGPDTTGPRLLSATGGDGSARVVLTFDEPLSSVTATLASAYGIAPAGGAPIPVQQVVLSASGRAVTLTIATPLSGGTSYVVTVNGVTDVAGNSIVPGASVTFTATLSAPSSARLTVQAKTLVRGMARQGEVMPIEAAGVPGSKTVVRVFDLRGRLVKVLFDGRLPANGRQALTWDARDESFELVPAGMYVCHMLTTDPRGVDSESHAPIVVAVRLQ